MIMPRLRAELSKYMEMCDGFGNASGQQSMESVVIRQATCVSAAKELVH